MRTAAKAKIISISLPQDMTKEVQEIAREERRSVSELIREALRQYSANRLVKDIRKSARKSAKRQSIKAQDIDRLIHEGRR